MSKRTESSSWSVISWLVGPGAVQVVSAPVCAPGGRFPVARLRPDRGNPARAWLVPVSLAFLPTYCLSQRTEHIWQSVSPAATRSQPIISTRDEPHARDGRFRRLQVTVGDSNRSETTMLLKAGSAGLVLRMIGAATMMRDLTLDNPIRAIRQVSHDMTGRSRIRLANGSELSALGIQSQYLKIIPDAGAGAGPCRGVVIPIGVNAEGGVVAAACDRADYPAEIDQLLLRLAANHAATAFQSACLIRERTRAEEELRKTRDELEMKVAERTAELRRSEAYLSEAQRLTHTGTAALNGVTGEVTHSSDEHSRLYGFDPVQGVPCFEEFRQRVHPEDRAGWTEALKRVLSGAASVEGDFRIVPPQGPLRHPAQSCIPSSPRAARSRNSWAPSWT